MACRPLGTKPLSEPILAHFIESMTTYFREIQIKQEQFVYQNMYSKTLVAKWRSFCLLWFAIRISLMFVPKSATNDFLALAQKMAWRLPGDKPSSEPMMLSLLTHLCTTRPQWVKGYVNPSTCFAVDACKSRNTGTRVRVQHVSTVTSVLTRIAVTFHDFWGKILHN